jgi:hypothetical protein
MAGRKQAGHTIETLAEVIAVPFLRHTGVECHADAHGANVSPFLRRKRSLRRYCGSEGIARDGKGGTASIANHLEDGAMMLMDNLPQQRIVSRDRYLHRPRKLLPAPRAPFDICEEEGDRAGRQGRRNVSHVHTA